MQKSDIWVIGLGVMWQNLALNISDKGFPVSVYNRTYSKTQDFLAENEKSENLAGYEELKDFISSLALPRKVMLMVQAGPATDSVIDSISLLLERWDLIIDGGNAHWQNTISREKRLSEKWIHFIGSGVSGWEEGARHGPSLMPGGDKEAFEAIRPIWESIAAKDFSGKPCTTYVGKSAAGNFVKMVHNGIEYALMQAIAEIYDLLRYSSTSNEDIWDIFAKLNTGLLESFLLEITTDIFSHKDPRDTEKYLIDVIRDRAKSKGTGGWTVQSAIDLGVPVPTISEALMARQISAREWTFEIEGQQTDTHIQDIDISIDQLKETLTLAYLGSYLQGLDVIVHASEEYSWDIDIAEVIRIWQWGCIIRSRLLEILPCFFDENYGDKALKEKYTQLQSNLKKMLDATSWVLDKPRIPTPVLGSIRDYFMTLYRQKLPTNLIQAQRDYFGAHTFERTDSPDGEVFHHDWQ